MEVPTPCIKPSCKATSSDGPIYRVSPKGGTFEGVCGLHVEYGRVLWHRQSCPTCHAPMGADCRKADGTLLGHHHRARREAVGR